MWFPATCISVHALAKCIGYHLLNMHILDSGHTYIIYLYIHICIIPLSPLSRPLVPIDRMNLSLTGFDFLLELNPRALLSLPHETASNETFKYLCVESCLPPSLRCGVAWTRRELSFALLSLSNVPRNVSLSLYGVVELIKVKTKTRPRWDKFNQALLLGLFFFPATA